MLAGGRNRQREDGADVPRQLAENGTCFAFANSDRAVQRGNGELFPIWRNRQRVKRRFEWTERMQQFALGAAPHFHAPILAASQERSAIRLKGDRVSTGGVAFQSARLRSFPKDHVPFRVRAGE